MTIEWRGFLTAWAVMHRERTEELRRELSLRLPSARLLEFTSDAPDTPVISMSDDGSLAGTYALIFDLRLNGGDSPHGVAFWCSYRLPEEPIRLN